MQAAGLTNFLPATGATLRYQVSVDGLTGPNADGIDDGRHAHDQRRLPPRHPGIARRRRVVSRPKMDFKARARRS